ncbi:MAG TPA: hypothetical protein VD835_14550 [Pyrinomonadaceae bacterium]|nr:hypothetical protein [Pyrinomonadaceae bacterium]
MSGKTESVVERGRPAGAKPQGAAATRTVGVYERPARRAGLSLPLVVILILSVLISVVAAARFLF